jgi:hypothetical protein
VRRDWGVEPLTDVTQGILAGRAYPSVITNTRVLLQA